MSFMMITGNALPRTSPEAQGIASAAVLEFVQALEQQIHEVHSFMLLRHGKVVAEGWWSPYAPEQNHLLFSLSKSFTSTAVGLAVAEGYFSVNDAVLPFFADEAPAEVSDLLAAMRVRDLLSMSSGQAEDTWSHMVDRADGNWIKGFFEVPVLHTPGTHFVYNTGATYMLSALVQHATGMTLLDYLQPRLFEPLGIENATWTESPQGITAGGIGMSATIEDIARFGQLYLQKGMWQGQQILPEAWVEAATCTQIDNRGMQVDWNQGYGYQFWRCRHGAYRGDGVFGQYCIVMPEQDAVLAITSGMDVFDMQQPLNLVWDILLPAMQAEALAEDATTQNALAHKLSNLNMATVHGEASSPLAAQVSSRTYALDANALGLNRIAFSFNDAGFTVNVKTASVDEIFPCGYGVWQANETSIFKQRLLFDRTPVACSGAWTTQDTFTIVARLIETPFFHTLKCYFSGDELMVEIGVNVSMESMEPLLLMGKAL